MAKKDQALETPPAEGTPTPEDPAILQEFEDLAQALGVQLADPEEVDAEREVLLGQIAELTTQRNALDSQIATAQAKVKALANTHVRVADLCKTATKFGKKVPAKYAGMGTNSLPATSNGARYAFEGFDSTDKRLADCTLSRGLVIVTPGCEGSGLDGRLHKAEFIDYLGTLGKALPENEGDEVEVLLKNGKSGKVRRIS